MPRRLVKDRAAESDLIDIWVYSFERWGEAQAERYLDALKYGIRRLIEDPRGKPRDTLRVQAPVFLRAQGTRPTGPEPDSCSRL